MAKKLSVSLFDPGEVDGLILKILSRSQFGLSPDKVRKDLPPSHRIRKEQLTARLDELVSQGRVYAWHPPGGKAEKPPHPIYSLGPSERLIQSEILNRLKGQPLTPGQIKKCFPAPVNKYLQLFWEPLLRDRTVKWHPPLKGKRLGLEEPNPADFLAAEIKKLLLKGKDLGFSTGAILQAIQRYLEPEPSRRPSSLSAEEVERIIFPAMALLKPAAVQGALVYIPDLREAVRETFPGKASFDKAILHLAELEKVQLQSHSLPAELTEEERAAMIDNGRGSYFMAIGIRGK